MLKGNLSGFSLGEILQSLAINKHTGTLTLTTSSGKKHIYFEGGDIRFFSHGKPSTPRIGEILVRSGILEHQQLESALVDAKASGRLLGRVLLDLGLVSEEDIRSALELKVREELYELFAYDEGEFEFNLDICSDEVFDQLQRAVGIQINTNGVIMEGLRRLDEWQMIHERVRTENEIFVATGAALPAKTDAPVADILSCIDGVATTEEIVKVYPGPKFDLLKGIYNLLVAGTIRPLTVDELTAAAQGAKAGGDFPRAAAFYRFAVESSPDDAALRIELGDALARFFQDQEANDAYLAALRICHASSDWTGAAAVAEKLPPNANLDIDSLEKLVEIYIALRETKKALWAGQQLATLHQRDGETQRAAEVLDSLIEVDPSDLNLRVQIATLFHQVGDNERATHYYEEVAEALEQQRKIKDQIKILKLILELNPKRVEIKQQITTLAALQDKIERQRKRRLSAAGAGIILLVICTVIPFIYEIKARELFSHAQRMHQIALSNGDYSRAKRLFEQLVQDYGMSTKAYESKLVLESIHQIEGNIEATLRSELERKQREQEADRKELQVRIESLVRDADDAAQKHDLERAHALFREAYELSKSSRKVLKLELPVLIDSNPKGAELLVNGQALGRTPIIVRYTPGQQIDFALRRRGCVDLDEKVVLEDQTVLHRTLTRRASAEIVLPSNFEQPVHSADLGNIFVFPSRDGHVYAYDPEERSITLKKPVGEFGDRLSDLLVRNGYAYVGTVDNTVLGFHIKTGARKWPVRNIRGPFVAAPATTDDGNWLAVANVHGEVYLLDNRSGRVETTFATENEIVASPLFADDLLLVGCRDDYVYGFDLRSKKVDFIIELLGDVEADPIRYGRDAIFATKDGRVHRVDTHERRVAWSVKVTQREAKQLLATPTHILAALSTGEVLALDPNSGAVDERWEVHSSEPGGMMLDGDTLFVGYQSGFLAAWSIARKQLDWSWQADASIEAAPVLLNRKLYVACNSGTVQVLELD